MSIKHLVWSCLNTVYLRLYCACESLVNLAEMQVLIRLAWARIRSATFLSQLQVTLMLLLRKPLLE